MLTRAVVKILSSNEEWFLLLLIQQLHIDTRDFCGQERAACQPISCYTVNVNSFPIAPMQQWATGRLWSPLRWNRDYCSSILKDNLNLDHLWQMTIHLLGWPACCRWFNWDRCAGKPMNSLNSYIKFFFLVNFKLHNLNGLNNILLFFFLNRPRWTAKVI